MGKIPYGKQKIEREDIAVMAEIMGNPFITSGPKIADFERKFSQYTGAKYAVACSSGTAALHLSAMAAGLRTGDVVITSPITFVATANSVLNCGGDIIFADINSNTYTLDFNRVEEIIRLSRRKIKAIIPVSMAGYPINNSDLKYFHDKYDVTIIEDNCHSIGAETLYNDKWLKAGSNEESQMSCFSFHPVKHITTGEGGMITTNDKSLYDILLSLRNHGITRSKELSDKFGGWYYEVCSPGYNYRMTDFQAALGISQLSRIDENIDRRRKIAQRYYDELSDLPIILPYNSENIKHAYHLFIIQTLNRRELYNFLINNGIYVQVHYIPLHQMPLFKGKCLNQYNLTNSEMYYERALSIPIFHAMTDDEQNYVIEKIKEFCHNNNHSKRAIPLLNKDLCEGSIVDFENDVEFVFSEKGGLSKAELNDMISNFMVLSKDKKKGEPLNKNDFRKAVIATIVAARLKSKRLPKKAILKIGKLSSIEICLKNCLKFKNIDYTVLATSTNEQDSELKNYTYSDEVIFHRGDPVDVVNRYVDIIDKLNVDIVVRITGDMPYVSNEILQILLKSHFANGADYTGPTNAAIGTNLQIVNAKAYRKIIELFDDRRYSGYLTFYFWNNPNIFKVNEIPLPDELARDYRLTLDYPEDLEMFERIEEYFDESEQEFDLLKLFEFLDNNPEIADINRHCNVVYKTDKELIDKINMGTTHK